MERKISNEDIDAAIDEWSKLGFTQESLDILRHRLYDKVTSFEITNKKYVFGAEYFGFYPDRNLHVIGLKEEEYEKASTIHHEIRHGMQAEIFRILLDQDSEVYYGLSEEQKGERLLEVYETVKPLINSNTVGFFTGIGGFRKGVRKGIKSLKKINSSDKRNVVEEIRKNRELYAYALENAFACKNKSRSETLCMTAEEVKKGSLQNRVLLSSFLAVSAAYAYGWTIPYVASSNLLGSLYMYGMCLPMGLAFVYFGSNRYYGNKKSVKKLVDRLSPGQEPYQQFLSFIDC